jgi:GT2 family glycosyltransferase
MQKSNFAKFSIIILNYNGKEFLERCLSSVLNTNYPNFEVILVDNASTDGSVEFVKKNFPSVKVIANKVNLHFTGGNNIGIKAARGEYIVLLNNDTEVHPNWLSEIVKVMEIDPSVGLCQCKLLFMDNREEIDSTGGFINYLGLCEERGKGEIDKHQYDQIDEIFHAKGAALVVKREVLNEVGLFDSFFYYNYEDVDLCWRARLRGYKVVFCPKAIVYHHRSSPTKKKFQLKSEGMFHSAKNVIRMIIKNYALINLIFVLPVLILIEISAAVLLPIKGQKDYSKAIVKAMLWNIRNIKSTLEERRKIQLMRRMSDKDIKRAMKRVLKLDLKRPEFTSATC